MLTSSSSVAELLGRSWPWVGGSSPKSSSSERTPPCRRCRLASSASWSAASRTPLALSLASLAGGLYAPDTASSTSALSCMSTAAGIVGGLMLVDSRSSELDELRASSSLPLLATDESSEDGGGSRATPTSSSMSGASAAPSGGGEGIPSLPCSPGGGLGMAVGAAMGDVEVTASSSV